MLTADGQALRPIVRGPDRLLWPAIGASAALHLGLVAGLLLPWRWSRPLPNLPPLEIEMIPAIAMTRGAAKQTPKPPPTHAQASPKLPQGTPDQHEPAPPAPSRPTPAPPAVNIGNGPEQSSPLVVTGDNIVPPAPDSRYRNLPPNYPPEAARAGAEGTVQLLIRVSSAGVPIAVQLVHSSGNASLDAAARRAVEFWRFRPARADGRAVPFDYMLNIRFALGDH